METETRRRQPRRYGNKAVDWAILWHRSERKRPQRLPRRVRDHINDCGIVYTLEICRKAGYQWIDFNEYPVAPFAQAQQEILGEDHAYPMIAYGTMQASAAWKLYAKSQGVTFETANAVSNEIKAYEDALKHANEDDKDNIDPHDFISPQYHEIFDKSADYRGIVTSWSIAPCGYLLYSGSIRKEIGLVKIKDNICCLMDGHWAEDGHFLKNDLLAVQVVGLINRAFQRVGMKTPTVQELIRMCPPNDACWDIYRKGCTIGINQCEQPGTSARVGVYAPKNISELSAFVAAIRPG